MAVRPATPADSALLLAWRNDSETRARSRSTALVTPAEHDAWLANVLNDPTRRLLIAERDGHPIGTVRFDRGDDHWEVSITVAPEVRGRGLAVPILLAAERSLRNTTIRAHVHRDHVASQALFRRAGYQERHIDGYQEEHIDGRAGYQERRADPGHQERHTNSEWSRLDKTV